jgi:hypothetical protein
MGAILLRRERYVDADGDLVELVLWQVPRSAAYPDGIRYRLAFVLAGIPKPAVLYDNHHPKGHHRHRGHAQIAYPLPPLTNSWWTSSRTFSAQRCGGGRGEDEGPD